MESILKELLNYAWVLLVALIAEMWRRLNGDIKAARILAEASVKRDDFKDYMLSAEKSRAEFRQTIIDLFKKVDDHATEDKILFREITKQINDQTNELTKTIHNIHAETLRAIPKRKED